MQYIKYFLFIIFALFSVILNSQEFPPIQVFAPNDYGAEDQNWKISQSMDNYIYVANNKGLLEYDGATWNVYDSPNSGILRSVRVVGNKIYTGGYMDFGYWTKNNEGTMLYTSLKHALTTKIKEDEDFWSIIDLEGFVLFQSFDRIYVYNTANSSVSIIESEARINKMFKVGDAIYFQKTGVGVFEIINGVPEMILSSEIINSNVLVNIFKADNGLLLQTQSNGFYTFNNHEIAKWETPSNSLLSTLSVYSSIKLKNGGYMIGTISNGIVQLDKHGNELLRIDQNYGLSNNTVLSMLEDNYGNIWLGLDNGINVININSPFRVYKDKQGELGTVYTSAKVNEVIYLGTNHGLFYKLIDSKEKFKFVEGTEGQVWNLSVINDTLFCGHDSGTFIIEGFSASKVSSELGTWIIKEIDSAPNLLIQGNYRGLNILEKINNQWRHRNKIAGFNISSRYIEFISSNELLVSHEHKGVYKIKIDDAFRRITNLKELPVNKGVKSSIVRYNEKVLYGFKEGVFEYDDKKELFQKDSVLSSVFSADHYVSGKLISDEKENKLWGFTQNEIVCISPGNLTHKPKIDKIAISSMARKTKSAFENVLNLGNNYYLIGTTEGYLVMDLNKFIDKALDIKLNTVFCGNLPNALVPIDTHKTDVFKNKSNNIKFNYSVANFNKFITSKYQYKLTGIYDEWSDWSAEPEVFFKNLPHGDYTFEARAKTGGEVSNTRITYSFTIEKPWYLRSIAIITYFLLALLFIYILFYFNRKHYKKIQKKLIEKKQRQLEIEQLENQRQLIQFKNKNLQLDIENKNRELGMATMNLVKRNELLGSIKNELSKSKSLNEVGKVIKTINSSINDTSDWALFEKAFNNVDKDFMQRIKALHPTITPNDLRLCAYLRLNLSSKEIAPLLNISHKSVEVKRYRLRKKLDLDHKQSLTNYIIEL
ncbi:LuxR family transcriptional regulator [Winogradskyella eckloniae]|uniref:triple tyrosine motif-containing protein n=1 Tax=Winogradskyella eckloniae TaxID=1089306 RepID=UPI0015669948|nr:triple tyrosine motif-containing protein [Winogradskyella eckloniae]NRD21271.1 LuxR family transcriptional regulator [Winogradskyella eckloniae]